MSRTLARAVATVLQASVNVRGLDVAVVSVAGPFPASAQVSAMSVVPLFAAVVLSGSRSNRPARWRCGGSAAGRARAGVSVEGCAR